MGRMGRPMDGNMGRPMGRHTRSVGVPRVPRAAQGPSHTSYWTRGTVWNATRLALVLGQGVGRSRDTWNDPRVQ